jgi:hypothetical protein
VEDAGEGRSARTSRACDRADDPVPARIARRCINDRRDVELTRLILERLDGSVSQLEQRASRYIGRRLDEGIVPSSA